MKIKLRYLPLIIFSVFVIFSFAMCKSKGKGKIIYKVEAKTEKLSSENVKLIEAIYLKRLVTFGIDEEDISIKTEGKIVTISISEVSNYSSKLTDRIPKLLQATAKLEFWETYFVFELGQKLYECSVIDSLRKPKLSELVGAQPDGRLCCMFYAIPKDTSSVNLIMKDYLLMNKLPNNVCFKWTAKPVDGTGTAFGLIALKSGINGGAILSDVVLTDVHTIKSDYGGGPEISMTMDDKTALEWAKLTKANMGRQIAIVVDGAVYTYPTVQGEITGGRSQITGNFTIEEANELVAILKIEPLPFVMSIVSKEFIP